jgi:hypothetical protein
MAKGVSVRMNLSTKILLAGLCISLLLGSFIFLSILPLGWTGMPELIPAHIMRGIIFAALGLGLLLLAIGIVAKVVNALRKSK